MVRSVRALEGVSVPSMVLAFSAALRSSCSFGLVLALRMAIGLLDGRRRRIPSRVRTWVPRVLPQFSYVEGQASSGTAQPVRQILFWCS